MQLATHPCLTDRYIQADGLLTEWSTLNQGLHMVQVLLSPLIVQKGRKSVKLCTSACITCLRLPEALNQQSVQLGQSTDACWHPLKAAAVQL